MYDKVKTYKGGTTATRAILQGVAGGLVVGCIFKYFSDQHLNKTTRYYAWLEQQEKKENLERLKSLQQEHKQ